MRRRRIGLFVMIDALGFRHLRQVDFLPELEYRVGLRTVLGFSCSCHPTIFTGRMPAQHGHGAMFRRRDGHSVLDVARPFAWLPSFVADNHRVRARLYGKVAEQVDGYFSLYECPTRLLPRFDLVEKRSVFAPGGIRQGRGIFDRLEELGLKWSCYHWRTPEEENLLAVETDIREGAVDFVFLYLPGLDGLLHRHGPMGEAVQEHLAWYEGWLRRLLELAMERVDVVDAFVFSDHGMSEVHGGVDLITEIESELGRNGRRYLAFYDSTMARFWVDDPAVRRRLEALLARRGDGRLIPVDEQAELGVLFEDRSQGDLIYVVEEGLILLPSYMGRELLGGMHGYHPDAAWADASLLGLRPASEQPTHIRDLYGLMERAAVRLREERA